ncbi:MAG: sigma-70 family RNA polymerase sigma factor [Blastochloris sp.]|jgi:RNA polymerase sigma-70 factor (ECF subfamily)|nr:sigma-70 family RNA polymerase sigma factor [Blastochloris sp.]
MLSGESTPPSSDRSDEELVDSVLSGDISSFDHLVIRYKERLYSVLYNMTSNHEDSNDMLMETFDKAFRSLSQYRKNASFYTWIYRIAMNRTINHLNKHKKRRYDLSLNDLDSDESMERQLKDTGIITSSKQSELSELQNKLNESLQKLSEEHRAVVVLYDIDGMSHADIGKIMNCSEGTVRSRLHYAHKLLQKMLATYLDNT